MDDKGIIRAETRFTGWVYPTVVVLSDFDVLDNAVVPWKHVNNKH